MKRILSRSLAASYCIMRLNQQIEDHLDKTRIVLLNLTLLIGDLNYLSKCEGNREYEILESYRFFLRIWHGLYLYTILELYKITNENEDYSQIKILNTLKNRYRGINWMTSMSLEDIDSQICKLKDPDIQAISNKITIIRDESIAHMDRVRSEISIELHELNTIYMLCSSVYNKIQYCLKGSQDIFEFSEFDKGHSLITHLANYKEIEKLVYESHSGLVAEMETDKILSIIRKTKDGN